jgi:septal ring factor EnvC (AmiA/AmiB activator)
MAHKLRKRIAELEFALEVTARRLEAYKQKAEEDAAKEYENHRKNRTGPFKPWDHMSFTNPTK